MSRFNSLATTVAGVALVASFGALWPAGTAGAAPGHTGQAGQAGSTEQTGQAALPCGGEQPPKPGGGLYTCSFDDEFDGSTLDTSKWLVQETWFSGMTTGNHDCYVNDAKNVSVGAGTLRLTNRVEPKPFVCHSPYGDFTTRTTAATIGSYARFTQTDGLFEFRAKFPDTARPGIHSALWLYPQKHTYGAWPNSGEIDVAERFSAVFDHVYPSVHYAGEDPRFSSGYNCVVPTAGSQFHTYAVEWTPTVMRFLYDGNLCFQHSWTPDAPLVAPQPFDQPFYLVLSQAFGSGWNAVDNTTPRSATMLVDWVRAWK